MEASSTDDFMLEHQVEEEWEFDAPQFFDFTNSNEEAQDVDLWFDAKLHDDVSPEIDWDEYEVEHDFGTGPASPASVHASYSAAATPKTPQWRADRVESRSPQRIIMAMDAAEEVEVEQIPSESSPSSSAPSSAMNSPYRATEVEHMPVQPTTCTIAPILALPMTPQHGNTNVSISTSIPGKAAISIAVSSSTENQSQRSMVATAVVTHPTSQATKKVGLSTSASSARLNPVPIKAPVSTKSFVHGLTQKTEANKTGLSMPQAPASKLGTSTAKSGAPRSMPLQPVSQNRLNQPYNAPALANKSTNNVRRTMAAKKTSPARPIKHQPYASQRSVVPPIRTNASSKTIVKSQSTVTRPPRVPLAEKSTVSSMMRAKATAASLAASAQPKAVVVSKRPLTVAVTPEFMKRRAARLKNEPRMTTEQLRAMEAERQRRAFLQELARKNANRGMAPRVEYHHGQSTVTTGPQNRWKR